MGRKLRKAEGEIEMAKKRDFMFLCMCATDRMLLHCKECGEAGSWLESAGEEPVIILICVEDH